MVSVCRKGGEAETEISCLNGMDWNCDGRVGAADPGCQQYLR